MRIVKGVGDFTGISALGEFPHEGGEGISRSRIRGLKKDGEFQKVGCLQPFYTSLFTPSSSSLCPFVFTKDMVRLSCRYLPLPCFVCNEKKNGIDCYLFLL